MERDDWTNYAMMCCAMYAIKYHFWHHSYLPSSLEHSNMECDPDPLSIIPLVKVSLHRLR